MAAIPGLLIAVLISALVSGLIIWIVSKLDLGLHVDSFGWAMLKGLTVKGYKGAVIAAVSIAVVGFLFVLVALGGASIVGQATGG